MMSEEVARVVYLDDPEATLTEVDSVANSRHLAGVNYDDPLSFLERMEHCTQEDFGTHIDTQERVGAGIADIAIATPTACIDRNACVSVVKCGYHKNKKIVVKKEGGRAAGVAQVAHVAQTKQPLGHKKGVRRLKERYVAHFEGCRIG